MGDNGNSFRVSCVYSLALCAIEFRFLFVKILLLYPDEMVGSPYSQGRATSSDFDGDQYSSGRRKSITGIRNRKIVILGDRGVGKTSLVNRFVTGKFESEYNPTIETTIRKTISFHGIPMNIELVDTAGMDEYSRISRNAMVGVDGYIMVYSISSMSSLEKLRDINTTLLHMLGDPPSLPRVLVGTMSDLEAENRQVDVEAGISLAKELGVRFCDEVSSKFGDKVETSFYELLLDILAESDESSFREVEGTPQEGNSCCVM